MNHGFVICAAMGLLFLFFAFIFTILEGKAAMLISGFNTMPKEKRKLYDQKRMSQDQRNAFLTWALILAAGAVLSYFISPYTAIGAFAIWLIVFFKDVHFDEEKAFGKYRKQ